MPITEDDDLAALDLLVAAETEVIASFPSGGGRAITVDDGDVQTIVLSTP